MRMPVTEDQKLEDAKNEIAARKRELWKRLIGYMDTMGQLSAAGGATLEKRLKEAFEFGFDAGIDFAVWHARQMKLVRIEEERKIKEDSQQDGQQNSALLAGAQGQEASTPQGEAQG